MKKELENLRESLKPDVRSAYISDLRAKGIIIPAELSFRSIALLWAYNCKMFGPAGTGKSHFVMDGKEE